jgi:hypothetical protein
LHSINGHTVLTAIRQTGACFTTHLRGVDDGVDGIFVHKVRVNRRIWSGQAPQ